MTRTRWERFVEPQEAVPLLWKAKEELKLAWSWDGAFHKGYPVNLSYAIERTRTNLANLSKQPQPKKPKAALSRRLSSPKSLNDLVPEKIVATKWEEQHSGSFQEALKVAADVNLRNPKNSWKAFQGIIHALEQAYMVRYWGIEFLQKPKVNIAHQGLTRIANEAGLRGLTAKGFAKFLDSLCPCGLKDHTGAVRKLWRRSPSSRLSKG